MSSLELSKKMQISKLGLILIAVVGAGSIVGCNSGPPAVEKASPEEVNKIVGLRKIFDSVQGDYSQLTPDQKKEFLDYSKGDQKKVDSLWSFMKNPRGGGVEKPGAPFQQGAGGKILPPGTTQ